MLKGEKKSKSKATVKAYKDPDMKEFEFGTIVLTCKCGREQVLMEHIEHGIQFILATNDKSGLTFHCDECHSDLRLHCKEGTPPPEEVTAEVEEVPAVSEVEINETLDEDISEEGREGESI